MEHHAATSLDLWDESKPELLPRYADWFHGHPRTRRELSPRTHHHTALNAIAAILLAPIAFVWVLCMSVFLLPIMPVLAVIFWAPFGAHYHEPESPDPRRFEEPMAHPSDVPTAPGFFTQQRA